MSKFITLSTLSRFKDNIVTLLNNKVDKVTGKGLSTEDFTPAEKTKLAGIATGAEVNIQSDWNQTDTSADDFVKNKPTIPTVDQTFDATSQNPQSGVAIASVLGGVTTYKSNTIRVSVNYYPATPITKNGYTVSSSGGYCLYVAGKSWTDAGGTVDLPDGIYLAFLNNAIDSVTLPLPVMVSRAYSTTKVFVGAGIQYNYVSNYPSTSNESLDANTVYVRIGDYPS